MPRDEQQLGFDGEFADFVRQFSLQLENTHRTHASSRPLSQDYEFIGAAAQMHFARQYNVLMDFAERPGGDGGHDFFVPLRMTVDIKAARIPKYLLVEQGKVRADIYVLARYIDGAPPRFMFLRWAYGRAVLRWPTADIGGKGIISHYKLAEELPQMAELEARLMRLR